MVLERWGRAIMRARGAEGIILRIASLSFISEEELSSPPSRTDRCDGLRLRAAIAVRVVFLAFLEVLTGAADNVEVVVKGFTTRSSTEDEKGWNCFMGFVSAAVR